MATTVTSTAPSRPTGTVVFKNGTTSVGSGTLSTPGVATVTTRTLLPGSLSITSTYNGDSETGKSTSTVLPQTVTQTTSATTMKSSLNPSLSGQTVTFTAFVTSPTPMPTGTATFMDGGTILGTGTLSGGKATYGTALSSASHNFADVSAIYDGPSNIKGSNSARSMRRRAISGCEIMELSRMGRLAQLVRAPALQAGGRRFESCTAHQYFHRT